jgi:hypothetical protein
MEKLGSKPTTFFNNAYWRRIMSSSEELNEMLKNKDIPQPEGKIVADWYRSTEPSLDQTLILIAKMKRQLADAKNEIALKTLALKAADEKLHKLGVEGYLS